MHTELQKIPPWSVSVLAVGASLGLLFGYLPYAYGYGTVPITTWTMLWRLWMDNPDWQHGSMVPFISLGLVIWDWDQLKRIPVRPDWRGWILYGFSAGLFYLGFLADVQYLAFFSLQAFLGSAILIFWGTAAFRRLLFPWAFLFFAWPLPFLDNAISFPLRVFMTQVSHLFLNLIGIDTLRVGTSLVSAPDFAAGLNQGERFALDVANPCSGIRSLFALMMISALYGHLTLQQNWQKAVLFAASFPLAVLGNFVRVLMLTFGTLFLGNDIAIGTEANPTTFHMTAGFAALLVALGWMAGMSRLLEGTGKTASRHAPSAPIVG
jgi:exosortase